MDDVMIKCPFHKKKMIASDVKIKGEPFILLRCPECSFCLKMNEEQYKKSQEVKHEIHNDSE